MTDLNPHSDLHSPWRFSTAPCMDWTDRHCRRFWRTLTRQARVYTEMVTTGALLHGDVERHLRFNEEEHPVALQLGGAVAADLAQCAALGEERGYDEINLNCGCPSDRVQNGRFGACLMAEPALVRDCITAMREACNIPVTVKHRIGIDHQECYSELVDFVGTVASGGAEVFIVHARKAWLQGLSPKENREIPPLNYDWVYHLKRDFPELTIVINGGIETLDACEQHLEHVDGVMLGRPGNVKATTIGHLYHLKRVRGDVAHVIAVIKTFQIDRKLKLHVLNPPGSPGHNPAAPVRISCRGTPPQITTFLMLTKIFGQKWPVKRHKIVISRHRRAK